MADEKPKFSLRAVIEAVEGADENCQFFANVKTGEVDCCIDPMFSGFQYDDDAFEGEEWLALPDRFERDDWGAMRDFAYALGGSVGEDLLDDIHGRGAFRAFRFTVERRGLLGSWYAFKDERLRHLAEEWLDEQGLAWEDDCHESQKRDWRSLLPASLRTHLALSVLDRRLSVCKFAEVPEGLSGEGFFFVARTDDELSVVCETGLLCDGATAREDGWRALKVQGPLDFGLVGILAKITSALADADVPVFAVSTYDTDYVLVKEGDLQAAVEALREAGCDVVA